MVNASNAAELHSFEKKTHNRDVLTRVINTHTWNCGVQKRHSTLPVFGLKKKRHTNTRLTRQHIQKTVLVEHIALAFYTFYTMNTFDWYAISIRDRNERKTRTAHKGYLP